MALITGTIPSFIGGVSQQDESIRSRAQLNEAINCWLSAARGAGKRPPTQVVVQLAGFTKDAFYHSIVRDKNERYIVVVAGGVVRVFNHITGHEYTVSMASGSGAYLASIKRPAEAFRATTVADTTFIVNREVSPKMDAALSPGSIAGSVQTFTDLPKTPTIGAIYEIKGDPNNNNDTYFVQALSATAYEEVAKPGIPHRFNKNTMPHLLKRVPDNVNPDGFYFSFGPYDWDVRQAGDAESNPPPSFVDDYIYDVFFTRDRLSFVTTENVILGETGFPFNFWRTTVTSLLDSDPVDSRPPTSEVVSLRHAVPFQAATMVFGTNTQIQVTADPIMSPRTIKINSVTNYRNNEFVRPILCGDSLFYVSDEGSATAIREYFVSDVAVTGDAADATAHCPAYIPKGARAFLSVPERDTVFLAIEGHESQLYVHNFHWQEDQKAQSAWSRWTLSGVGEVAHLHQIDGFLYVVAESPIGGVELLKIDLSPNASMASYGIPMDILLDRRVVVAGEYVALGNYTRYILPYSISSFDGFRAIRTNDWTAPGAQLTLAGATLAVGGTEVRLPGNYDGRELVCGLDYPSTLELSEQYMRDGNGAVVLHGRLQLRTLTVAFKDAAFFQVKVKPKGIAELVDGVVTERIQDYDGRTIGDAGLTLSTPKLTSGAFRTLIGARSSDVDITLSNPTPYPAWFQSATWEAAYTSRARQ